jgi:hypothetical protein
MGSRSVQGFKVNLIRFSREQEEYRCLRTNRLWGWLVAWIGIMWLLVAALPQLPAPIEDGVDASWNLALNMIHDQRLSFGRDIVYTSGPLGYLLTPEPDLASPWPVLSLRLLGWALSATVAVLVSKLYGPSTGLAAALVLCTQLILAPQYAKYFSDAMLVGYIPALLLVAMPLHGRFKWLVLAGLIAGLAMLIKVNDGLTAILLYLILSVATVWRSADWRLLPMLAALPAAVFLLGIAVTQGDLYGGLVFLWRSLELVRGYSEAMSYHGPVWQTGLILLYACLLAGMPAVLGNRWYWRSPEALCAGVAAFMAFKHSVVRQDVHADQALNRMAIAFLFLLVASRRPAERRVMAALMVFGALFTWTCAIGQRQIFARNALKQLSPSGVRETLAALFHWPERYYKLQAVADQKRQHLVLPSDFHDRVGRSSVDGFPHCIDAVRANRWNYRPRPTIESSAAYTARLDELNALHITGGHAPQFALFKWHAIDHRHPLLQEVATNWALIENYEPALFDADALLLERKSLRRHGVWIENAAIDASWGEWVPLPEIQAGESLLLSAQISRSTWGSLRSFFLRAPYIWIHLVRRSGRESRYRVIRDLLRSPSLIRPFPEDLAALAEVFRNPSFEEADPVARLCLRAPNPGSFAPRFRLTWHRVRWRGGLPASPKVRE